MLLEAICKVDIDNLIKNKSQNLFILIPRELSLLNFDTNEEFLEKGYITCSPALIVGDFSTTDTINRFYQAIEKDESLKNKYEYLILKVDINKGKIIYKLIDKDTVQLEINWCSNDN